MTTLQSTTPRPATAIAGVLLSLLNVLARPAGACPVCRPRVQATIHGPDFPQNLLLVLLPVGLLLLAGLGLFFFGGRARRISWFLSSRQHG